MKTFVLGGFGAALVFIACAKDSVPPPAIHADTSHPASTASTASAAVQAGPSGSSPTPSPGVGPSPSVTAAPATAARVRLIQAAAEGDVATIVRAQRVKAIEEKRILVVYVGADWCPPCKSFKEAVARQELDAQFADYTFLEFDLDRDGERLLQAGYGSKFIPLFVLPGADAKRKESFQISEVRNKQLAMKQMVEGLSKFRGQQ